MRKLTCLLLLSLVGSVQGSTINESNRYAYGANVGWMDFRVDGTNGVVATQYYLTGLVYAANLGWINVGQTPTNGYAYGNESADDFGVNVASGGVLRGYAYGANVGWINFETNGNPRINLLTGDFEGFAYGANIGWISLSNSQAYVKTDYLSTGPDSDGDGIPDPWEFKRMGNTAALAAGSDADSDGNLDYEEYVADSNPNEGTELLEITDMARFTTGALTMVEWPSTETRFYKIQKADAAGDAAVWSDSGLGTFAPDPGPVSQRSFADTGTGRIYRVAPVVPLAP